MSDARAQQKFRGIYRVLMNMFYILNPQCNEPIHRGLNRIARYSGDTTMFEELLGKLGDTFSAEHGRTDGIHDSLKMTLLRDTRVVAALKRGCSFGWIDDNLDDTALQQRVHYVQNSMAGKTVLIKAQDYDNVMAAQAGLGVHIAANGGKDGVVAAAAKLIHMEVPTRWVRPDARYWKNASPTPEEISREQLVQSGVIRIGDIVLAAMYDNSTHLSWLNEGVGRVLTLTFCVGFFGGDTVPKFHGFSPKTGLHAMVLAQAAIGSQGVQPGDIDTHNDSDVTVNIGTELVKAAHYLQRRSLYNTGAQEPAVWVAERTLAEIGQVVFENDGTPRLQVPTGGAGGQVAWQAHKTNTRLREWARAAMADNGLLSASKTADGSWDRNGLQVQAFFAMNAAGKVLPPTTLLTRENMCEHYGLGPDLDAMAAAAAPAGAAAQAGMAAGAQQEKDMRIRDNSELSLLSLADMQGKQVMSHACIKENIKARKPDSPLGSGYQASGQVLFDLVRDGVQPELAVAMDVSVATQPVGRTAASDDTAAPMQVVTQTAVHATVPSARHPCFLWLLRVMV